MGFGGPVWHASASNSRDDEALARFALRGVGNPLSEWPQEGHRATHLRRLMTPAEQDIVGPLADLRGTLEGRQILSHAAPWLDTLPGFDARMAEQEVSSAQGIEPRNPDKPREDPDGEQQRSNE